MAVSALALFSFTGVKESNQEISVVKATNSFESTNFHQSCETFPDKFTRWRETWTKYDNISDMEASLRDMEKTLKSF